MTGNNGTEALHVEQNAAGRRFSGQTEGRAANNYVEGQCGPGDEETEGSKAMGPLTRQEYEELAIRRQMERFGTPEAEARKTHELRYPKGTVAAILELELRGLRSSDWRVLAFVDERPDEAPLVVGGSRAWTKENVDAFARFLEERGDLTPAAAYRKELGLTWREEIGRAHV